jgi:hypothetical protein
MRSMHSLKLNLLEPSIRLLKLRHQRLDTEACEAAEIGVINVAIAILITRLALWRILVETHGRGHGCGKACIHGL